MGFWNQFFSGGSTWEQMPRLGKTFAEAQADHAMQALGISGRSMTMATFQVSATPTDFADKFCAWNIPTYVAMGDECVCFLKMNSPLVDDRMAASVKANQTVLEPKFKPCPTFPIVGLVLRVFTSEGRCGLEALPDLTNANIRDALDCLLRDGSGSFFLCTGDPLHLVAEGRFTTKVKELRKVLDKASAHYSSIPSSSRDYVRAGNLYLQSPEG